MSKPATSKNSYSLLLKSVKEIEKTKQPKKSAPKRRPSNDKESNEKDSSPKKSDTSSKQEKPVEKQKEIIEDPDMPDRTYGDFYCKLCDSHMNAIDMWEAHITGKRHIKNVEKGDSESKYDNLPGVQSLAMEDMRNIKDPVVGLSYIHEIRRKELNIPPIYNCFLCHASIATISLLIEHILSLKHRYNYIKENDPDQFNLISATNLKKGLMEPLVVEAVIKLEEKLGRGMVKVKQEKPKKPVTTYSIKKTLNRINNSEKRTFNMDDNRSHRDSRRPDPSVWKSPHPEHRLNRSRSRSRDLQEDSRRNRSRSRDLQEDSHRKRYRSRSPICLPERERRYPEEEYRNRLFSDRDSTCEILYEKHKSYSKKDVPSRYDDYNQDYLQPPRKNFPDEMPYRYTGHQEPVRTSSSRDQLKSSSQLLSSVLPTSGSNLTLAEVLKIISIINMDDRYQLLDTGVERCATDLQDINDVIYKLGHIRNVKNKMMHNDYYGPLMHFLSQGEDTPNKGNIPGLSETLATSAGISSKNSVETKSFNMNAFKDLNYQSMQAQQNAYFQTISSQQPANFNLMGNFPSSSGISYQNVGNINFPMRSPYPQNPNIRPPYSNQSSSSAERNYFH